MKKKTILHVIDYMGRGGAETMLVKVLRELKEYHNIVVTVNEQNNFGDDFSCDEYHCLKMGSFRNFPVAAWRLRKYLKGKKIDAVHSHLLLSTLVARLGVPRGTPFITTIHTNVEKSNDYRKWYLRFLEKFTYRLHRNIIIGVSQSVLEGYFRSLGHKPYKSYLLYTFVDLKEFSGPGAVTRSRPVPFRLIAVGALRHPKNQQYLVKAFEKLDRERFELHIYGTGVQQAELAALIADTGVNVIMKGEVRGISQLLPQYDAYVMPSFYEGFSLSVLEAMAMRMPMLLSDIPSFREQCADTALYFDLSDTGSFIGKLEQLAGNDDLRDQLGAAAKQRAETNFSLDHHMAGLRKIYQENF